ncbi:DUF3800 domain-containing protein [Leucobacter rhizosphaerae]|uniref:DUF3800 domain-containing protein n=1 Tax=Leucobacter rhizosphaerae TaxID=2932245 RepID=A0ABY4FVS3_9MICO|nr:DUF3800 domain-containing protein [Leucobacter rhizosphaerae]UOQ60401.1 DUF3800 domain-containing protein [Leucobacter rhizosphaerae]
MADPSKQRGRLPRRDFRNKLKRDHPSGLILLDETGAISQDRYFAVGIVTLDEPARTLRRIQTLRDKKHYYKEFKFSATTKDTIDLHRRFVEVAVEEGGLKFASFIADREVADPVARFGNHWDAYGKMAEQLLLGAVRFPMVYSVLADNYSSPGEVRFEEDLKAAVNKRLNRLGITTVVRLDSKSTDGLQLVDMLTSSIAFEFRAEAGLATHTSPKGKLARHVRDLMQVESCIGGNKSEMLNVREYEHDNWAATGTVTTAAV